MIIGGLRGAAAGMAGPVGAGVLADAAPRRDGSASAIAAPSATPSTTAELSVLPSTLTGVGVKPRRAAALPPRTNTTVPPSRSNTAPRGTCSTPTCGAPLIVTRPVSPGRRSVAGPASASVAENIRDGPAAPGPKNRCGMIVPTELTFAATVRPPRASSASVAVWPTASRARSFSSMSAPISSWPRSSTSAIAAPACT